MSEDTINGVALLLQDIENESKHKRMSAKDKIILQSLEYILKSLPPIREDVNNLKSSSLGYRIWQKPKASLVIILVLYSFLISDLRAPFFQWLFGMFGTLIKGM